MANFLAQRIINGLLDYTLAITRRPDLKNGIDDYLVLKGEVDLITS